MYCELRPRNGKLCSISARYYNIMLISTSSSSQTYRPMATFVLSHQILGLFILDSLKPVVAGLTLNDRTAIETTPRQLSLLLACDQKRPCITAYWLPPTQFANTSTLQNSTRLDNLVAYRIRYAPVEIMDAVTDYRNAPTDFPFLRMVEKNVTRLQYTTTAGEHLFGITYEFRVAAVGETSVGPEISARVSIPEAAPSDAPTNFRIVSGDETTIRLAWGPPNLPYRNGKITQYQVRCYVVGSEETTERIRSIVATELLLNDLPAATHSCFVRACTAVGSGPWSNRILFKIHSRVSGSPPPPGDVQYARINPTKVRVTWIPPSNSDRAVDIVQFVVYYRDESITSATAKESTWSRHITEDFATSTDLINLNERATYAIRVSSIDRQGNEGPSSPVVYVKPLKQDRMESTRTDRVFHGSGVSKGTSSTDYYAVRNLKCTEEEPDKIQLQWLPPAEEQNLVEYQVHHKGRKEFVTRTGISKVVHLGEGVLRHEHRKSSDPFVSSWVVRQLGTLDGRGELQSLQMEGLTPNSHYEFTVRPIYGINLIGNADEHSEGVSVSVICRTRWTKPNDIRPPELEAVHTTPSESTTFGTLVEIRVFRVSGENGPPHWYFLIVAPGRFGSMLPNKSPDDLSLAELSENALTPNNTLPYLAISASSHSLFKMNQDSAIIVLGSDQLKRKARLANANEMGLESSQGLFDKTHFAPTLGGIFGFDGFRAFNKPLHPQFIYRVASRTCSVYPDGTRLCASSEWSKPIHFQEPAKHNLIEADHSPIQFTASWYPPKLVAIVVGLACGLVFFVILSAILATILRQRKQRRTENYLRESCHWKTKLCKDMNKSTIADEVNNLNASFIEHKMYDGPTRSPCSYPSFGYLLHKSPSDLPSPPDSSVGLASGQRTLRPIAGGLVSDFTANFLKSQQLHCSHTSNLCGIEQPDGIILDKSLQSPSSPSRSLKSSVNARENFNVFSASEKSKLRDFSKNLEHSHSFSGRLPIPLSQFVEFVSQAKYDNLSAISDEFHSIECESKKHCFSISHSTLDQNKAKNRCSSVVPFDHNRVPLRGEVSGSLTGYINASYIDGYRKPKAYIATQAPLPETMDDFWTMVWEQRSQVIVMLTRLVERGEIQCDRYWPLNGSILYGSINVAHLDTIELAYYTMRTFMVQKTGSCEQRTVWHLQYTNWPEDINPIHSTAFLLFMRRIGTVMPAGSGPLLVHCSHGAGRTGLLIAIDILLEQIKNEQVLNVCKLVKCLRAQRMQLVSTLEQYHFVYHAVMEAIVDGNTEIYARNLESHVEHLSSLQTTGNREAIHMSSTEKRLEPATSESNCNGFQVEFRKITVGQFVPTTFTSWFTGGVSQSNTMELLTNIHKQPVLFETATMPVNQPKNRMADVVPFDWNRVQLHAIRGVDGSDYINASFVDGYRSKNAYIAAQSPMASTVEDFWRMVWEHRSSIIVMMCAIKEAGREQCFKYWPTTKAARYQFFVVDPIAEFNHSEYIVREFKITDARDGESRIVRQLQYMRWPVYGVPVSGESLIELIGQVHKMQNQASSPTPITVHCSSGTGRTGVFIALCNVLERLRQESVVDMYLTIKMLRQQRIWLVQTEQQYQFCYMVTLEYLSSFDLCTQRDPATAFTHTTLAKNHSVKTPKELCDLPVPDKFVELDLRTRWH